MGLTKRHVIWLVCIIGHDKADELVARPVKGGQDQVGVPQVPLQGHGDALET